MRVLVCLALLVGVAHAEPPRPAALAGVGVEEHVGRQVPLDLMFSSTDGRRVVLGDMFDGDRPVLLVLTYVRCKMLCSLVLRGTMDVVRGMTLQVGRDYRVVLVSIDPSEDLASAAARQRDIHARAGDWTYLIGAERPIHALADALGFKYALDPATDQFAHPAVIFVLTPDGRIARYLHGVTFDPTLVARTLRDARSGRVAEAAAADAVLSCFLFDPAQRAHRALIERYLQVGSVAVMLALMSLVGGLLLWERRRKRR